MPRAPPHVRRRASASSRRLARTGTSNFVLPVTFDDVARCAPIDSRTCGRHRRLCTAIAATPSSAAREQPGKPPIAFRYRTLQRGARWPRTTGTRRTRHSASRFGQISVSMTTATRGLDSIQEPRHRAGNVERQVAMLDGITERLREVRAEPVGVVVVTTNRLDRDSDSGASSRLAAAAWTSPTDTAWIHTHPRSDSIGAPSPNRSPSRRQ